MTNDQKSEVEEHEVKKLILIGNGFDLALGYRTSYQAFFEWVFIEEFKKALNKGEKKNQDEIKSQEKQHLHLWSEVKHECNLFTIILPRQFLIKVFIDDQEIVDNLSLEKIKEFHRKNNIRISFSLFNGVLQSIYENDYSFWSDFESVYYEILKEKVLQTTDKDHQKKRATELNTELIHIKGLLGDYLAKIIESNTVGINNRQKNAILDQIYTDIGINRPGFGSRNKKPKSFEGQVLILNFNYSPTLEDIGVPKEEINYIHGSIKVNDLVFGYGDEMDKDYKLLEDLNENELLRSIKSFSYFKNNRYRKLLQFIDSGPYQVCIYGHSCSISDRVLLNEIFESKNCKSIRVYYYRDITDYIDKTMNISRSFKSNQLMRRLVIDFQEEDKIPQRSDYE